MKIPIVTAVFNREATIAEAIMSVRRQTHADVEHIVQDGDLGTAHCQFCRHSLRRKCRS